MGSKVTKEENAWNVVKQGETNDKTDTKCDSDRKPPEKCDECGSTDEDVRNHPHNCYYYLEYRSCFYWS